MSSLFTPFSAALPLSHSRATVSCCSSGHVSFIKDVAVTEPPMHLQHSLKVLQTRGETIISPGAKQGLIPHAIPLSKDSSGSVTALLRWPTAPPGYDILVAIDGSALITAATLEIKHLKLADNQTLIQAINGNIQIKEIFGILRDIQQIASAFTELSFSLIPRTQNQVADSYH